MMQHRLRASNRWELEVIPYDDDAYAPEWQIIRGGVLRYLRSRDLQTDQKMMYNSRTELIVSCKQSIVFQAY